MLSKAQVKDIRGLTTGRGRAEAEAFVVEGDKMAREWLRSKASVHLLAATLEWLDANESLVRSTPITTIIRTTADDLARASSLSTPSQVLIVAALPPPPSYLAANEWTLVLDDIQDPGNVGTLIRVADWFGIQHVVASPASADFYNPKVVQAAMGGHLRVQLYKTELTRFLTGLKMPVIAAALDGERVYSFPKQDAAALIIGNESRGISKELLALADHKVSIPRRGGAESLNAGVSAGILCALLLAG